MKNDTPKEEHESIAFSNWLRIMGLPHHHSANEVPLQKRVGTKANGKPLWERSWGTLSKMYRMGVSKGFPDHLVIIPPERSFNGRALLLVIEMKRMKGGRATREQKEWLKSFREIRDVESFICAGFEVAKAKVEEYIR